MTEGFRDIYEIGRVNRPDAYNLFFRKHEPLVDALAALRGARAAAAPTAPCTRRSTRTQVRAVARDAQGAGRRGGRDPAAAFLSQPGARAARQADRRRRSCRAPSSPPRTSCRRSIASSSAPRPSAANAYVGPRVAHLPRRDREASRTAAASAATSSSCNRPAACSRSSMRRRDCVRMLESGPAAGVIGAQAICAQTRPAATPSPSTWAARRPRPA